MFDDVPKRLADYLRDAACDFDRESFYWFAAAYIGLFYLGKNLTKAETSDFLDLQRTSRGGIWHGYVGRVLLIGETLFLMRSCPGFSEFCRRMRGRDLRSTYYQMYAARMFLEGGYDVRAKPEVGIRREDFDFQAIADGETVNVEVTALTAESFPIQTIENALNHKRKQLPDTDASIIFCVLPESWATTENLGPSLGELTERFFHRTRRVTAVVFVVEMHVSGTDEPVGNFWIHHACLLHPNPRRPIRSFGFFANDAWEPTYVAPDGSPTMRRESDFFRWVDSIFSAKDIRVHHQSAIERRRFV
ncbi:MULTISPECIES: hypothetical protein [Bradyrhizobium]|uniref:Restriction endonuclease n=1 Tax=Bradyrhizobium brasilense TaxID=1419277 RepID=A0ABY8J5V1_9BRAD|nr:MULTISPECIES: hypothetical protein [Bradyrhizobium]MCP1833707.1 hypothetical protein [Bradyrhizobium sp. USDA 4545]MCP1852633.1 hypothetical protein [Bradyrhizobium sp. USDA 4541]MCP1918451.1 hypothetical protein [Bradyrhizobium sp. USDA 4532]WFU60925.1 hypothetical protein QA636_25660 [Bradyrhizobium brasilense]